MNGLDWFLSMATGMSKLSDMDKDNISFKKDQAGKDINRFGLQVEENKIGSIFVLPISAGVSWNKNKFYTGTEIGGNVCAFFSKSQQNLMHLKLMAGYEIFENMVVSFVCGVQMWKLNKINIKAKADSDLVQFDTSDFYLSDKKGLRQNSDGDYSLRFWSGFYGGELKYKIRPNIHMIFSVVTGLCKCSKTGTFYIVPEGRIQNSKSGTESTKIFEKNLSLHEKDASVSEISSKMIWQASIGFVVQSGGIL